MRYSIVLISLLSRFAAAQAGNWGQCGGENWSGATSCNAGWYCEYSNPWYSQCVPGSGSGSSATTSSVSSASATIVSSKTSSSSAASTTGSGSIPSASKTRFVIDGKAAYYAGTNAYWLPFLMNDADVDLVMGHLEESGLKILRVWGFNDVNTLPSPGTVYFQLLANGEQTINTGSDGLERLDAVVKSAESHGIKLIINFVNNWNDYGGINAYVNNYGGNKTEWYTNKNAQTAYQTYIKAVISRYTGSPAIFAWELANEPRCNGCDTDVIYNWAKTTSAYIKSLEPDRMVCIGDEGMGLSVDSDGSYPFGYSEGNDFEKTLTIDSIDFGTIHLYPSQWGLSDSWGSSWISAHGQACKKAGKPCLLEEYGSDSLCSSEAPWQSTAISTVAADLFWQWGDTLSTGESQHDDYTIWYGSDEYTCMVTDHVSAISSS